MNRLMQESGVNMREYDKAGEKSQAKAPPPPTNPPKRPQFGAQKPPAATVTPSKTLKRPPRNNFV